MDKVEIQPHVQIPYTEVQPVALVVGDPERALQVAKLCESHKQLAYNREYRSFTCQHQGQKFLVVSHGVGSAGAAICFEELIKTGVKCLIRLGTAGSLKPETFKTGDVVLVEGAVREDGVSGLLISPGYPSMTDMGVYSVLSQIGEQITSKPLKHGYTLTSDIFYQHDHLPNKLNFYHKVKGVNVVEMEVSALFIIAKLRGVKAGALVTLDGCPIPTDVNEYDPQGKAVSLGKEQMIKIGLASAVKITKEKLFL